MMVPKAVAIPMHSPREETQAVEGGRHEAGKQQHPQQSPPATQHDDAKPRRPSRPDNTRSSTDPSFNTTPSLLLQGYLKEKDSLKDFPRLSSSHRNRSPYSRSHLRSRSSGAVAGLPLMTRAHSMPSPYTPRPFEGNANGSGSGSSSSAGSGSLSPASRTPARTRSPFKDQEGAMATKGWADVGSAAGVGIESIQEDSELDFRPRGAASAGAQVLQPTALHASRVPSAHGGRRRPASPLYNQATPPSSSGSSSQAQQLPPTSFPATVMDHPTTLHGPPPSTSASSSPSLNPQQATREQKYNEAYPSALPPSAAPGQGPTLNHHSSATSLTSLSSFTSFSLSHPSTPTSARSRSPSISSLDTIEDEPEMEAKEAADEDEGGERRRSSLDGPRPSVGFGFNRGRSERKRWSVCGGERRGDLDLETIWED